MTDLRYATICSMKGSVYAEYLMGEIDCICEWVQRRVVGVLPAGCSMPPAARDSGNFMRDIGICAAF